MNTAGRMKLIVLVLCVLAPTVSWGQGTKLFKEKDVTESALIEALTPEEPIRTRSIRVMRDAEKAPVKEAAASLLITFETNSAKLTPHAKQLLEVVARALNSDKLAELKFAIEGHADPRGGPEYNLRLSEARAESVVNYLAEHYHINRERLKPVGKGETQLLNTEKPDAPENRRVVIKTLPE